MASCICRQSDGVQPCGRHVGGGDAAHGPAAGQTWRWGLIEVSACSDKQVSLQSSNVDRGGLIS